MTSGWAHQLPEEIYGIQGLLSHVNTITDSFFAPVTLLIVFTISFMSMQRYPTPQAYTAASFTTAIAGYMFFWLGLLGEMWVILLSLMVMASVFVVGLGGSDRP